jgi:hypothetical protein
MSTALMVVKQGIKDESDKATKLELRAFDIRNRDLRNVIIKALRARRDTLEPVKKCLMSLGALNADLKVVNMNGTIASDIAEDLIEIADDVDAGTGASGGTKGINHNFTKVQNMPNCHLERWLAMLEPISMNPTMLKKHITTRGARLQNHQKLSDIFETLTGIDPGTMLFNGEAATVAVLSAFEATMVKTYVEGPRWGRDLDLSTLDWDNRSGIYMKFVGGDGHYYLRSARSNVVAPIPHYLLEHVEHIKDMTISMNFSEARAMLNGQVPLSSKKCCDILSEYAATLVGSQVAPSTKSRDAPKRKLKELTDAEPIALLDGETGDAKKSKGVLAPTRCQSASAIPSGKACIVANPKVVAKKATSKKQEGPEVAQQVHTPKQSAQNQHIKGQSLVELLKAKTAATRQAQADEKTRAKSQLSFKPNRNRKP